jgi:hypothetical protein
MKNYELLMRQLDHLDTLGKLQSLDSEVKLEGETV